jgi:hypothetical protein
MCLILRIFRRELQSSPGILFLKPGGSMAATIAAENRRRAGGTGRAAANELNQSDFALADRSLCHKFHDFHKFP